jgi:hypothetical protein
LRQTNAARFASEVAIGSRQEITSEQEDGAVLLMRSEAKSLEAGQTVALLLLQCGTCERGTA